MSIFQWLYKLIFRKTNKNFRTEGVRTSNVAKVSDAERSPAKQKPNLQNPVKTASEFSHNLSVLAGEVCKEKADLQEMKSTDATVTEETVLSPAASELLESVDKFVAEANCSTDDELAVNKPGSEEHSDTPEYFANDVSATEEISSDNSDSAEAMQLSCISSENNPSIEDNEATEEIAENEFFCTDATAEEATNAASEQLLCNTTDDEAVSILDPVEGNNEPSDTEIANDESIEDEVAAANDSEKTEEITDEKKTDESVLTENNVELSVDEEGLTHVPENEPVIAENNISDCCKDFPDEQKNEIITNENFIEFDFEEKPLSEVTDDLFDDHSSETTDESISCIEEIQPPVSENDLVEIIDENADTDAALLEADSPSQNTSDVAENNSGNCDEIISEDSEQTVHAAAPVEMAKDEKTADTETIEVFGAEEAPVENESYDHIDSNEQLADTTEESCFFEEKGTTIPCIFDKMWDRLDALKNSWCAKWPLRRLLAFGASQEEIVSLTTEDDDTFAALEQFDRQSVALAPQKYAWLEKLEDQDWEIAFEMCEKWQDLLQSHFLASKVEHYRASGFSENLILAKTKLSSAEAQQLCKRFREAVLQWLNTWHAELNFLYDNSVLQIVKAEFFFGKLTFAIIRSVAEEAPNYGCAWLAYQELPFVLWNPSKKMSKYSIAALAEETFKQLKTAESYDDLVSWFEKELRKKALNLPAKTLLNILLETKCISSDDAFFKKGISFHNVIKGDRTREADSTHTSMAGEWNKFGKWLVQQFNLQPMLGAIELYDDEYTVLMEDFPKRIQHLRSIDDPEITDPLVCVELVQFAIRESKSGALWTKLGKLLCCKNTDPVMQWIGNLFIRTLTKYHKAVYEAGEKVASVLMHCFVCTPHVSDLFDFLYAYYRLDLIRDTDQMDVDALRERMVNNERYSYSHLVLQQTLDAMKYMPEISIARFEKYISWIDHAFWNIDWKTDENSRFALAFENWRSKHPDFNGSLRHHMSAATKGKRYFSKPYLELDLRNGTFWLTLPVQKLRFGMEEGACWNVKTDVQQTFRCELIEAVTCYHTEEIRIPLNESALLSEMTFELFANGKTKHLWNIEADCYRAFDEKGQLISDAYLETGTVYLFTKPNEKIQTQASCSQQMHGSWLLSVCDFSEGDVVGFPDGTVAVVGGETEEGLCGALPVEDAHIVLTDETKLPVYAEKPLLLLQTSEEHFSTGRLLLNGSYFELANLEHQSYALKNRTDENCWIITLPKAEDGLYQMQVDIAGEKDQRIWQFAVVPGLYYSFEGELPYWNQTVGKMMLNCMVPFQPIDMEFDENEYCYHFELSANRQEIRLALTSGVQLSIRIPMICWRVPNGEWSAMSPGDLWYTEFPDHIEFRSSAKHLTLSVDDENGPDKQHSVYCNAVNGSETIPCDTLPLRTWFTRNRICHSVYLTIGDTRCIFAQVYRTTYLQSAVFTPDFENNSIKGFLNLAGNGECIVRLLKEKETVVERVSIVDGKVDIPCPPEPGVYKACVYEAEADEFGFDETLYLLGEFDFEVKDPGDITGMTGYLKEIEPTEDHPEPLIFRHKYYWLDILERDPNHPNRYAARLREDDDFAKMFRKYRSTSVIVTLPNRTNIRRLRITYPTDLIPRAFSYEPKSHSLVKREKAGPDAIKLDSLDIFHIKFVEKV